MFLNTAAITYRYLFVMMETLGEMVEARTARQVGACTKKQARTLRRRRHRAILFAKECGMHRRDALGDGLAIYAKARALAANAPDGHFLMPPLRCPGSLRSFALFYYGVTMLLSTFNLNYSYADGTPALQDVNIDVASDDRLVILGANGSGKSTLLRLLNGLIFPDSGTVDFKGESVTEKALQDPRFRAEFRQCFGFVFQNADAQLFNATVFEEVAFGPRQLGLGEAVVKARVEETLEFLGISHLTDRPTFRISGGEKRKVAIASVLSMNPEVLMFDEPFIGLDPRSQGWLIRTIQHLQAAGKTTIVATHALETVPRIASKMIVLSESHRVELVDSVESGMKNLEMLWNMNLLEGCRAEVCV